MDNINLILIVTLPWSHIYVFVDKHSIFWCSPFLKNYLFSLRLGSKEICLIIHDRHTIKISIMKIIFIVSSNASMIVIITSLCLLADVNVDFL